MSSDRKNWEDGASTEGLGLLQDLVGVPNNPLLTKGELTLQLAQRATLATEKIAEGISDLDLQTVVIDDRDNAQAIEHLTDTLSSTLQQHFHDANLQHWRNSQANQKNADNNLRALTYLYRSSLGILDGVEEVNDQLDTIDDRFEKVAQEQGRQTSYLADILEAINTGQSDTKSNFTKLARIIVQQTRLQVVGLKKTRQSVSKSLNEVIRKTVLALMILDKRLTSIYDVLIRIEAEARETNRLIGEQTTVITDLRDKSLANQSLQNMRQGEKLLVNGLTAEAVKVLTKAVEDDMTNSKAHLLLACAFKQLKDNQKANYHLSVGQKLAENVDDQIFALTCLAKLPPSTDQVIPILITALDTPSPQDITPSTLGLIRPALNKITEEANLAELPENIIWSVIYIFLSNQDCLEQGRKLLLWLYKNSPVISRITGPGKYQEIAAIFQQRLGKAAATIKRFGEFPQEIRKSIV